MKATWLLLSFALAFVCGPTAGVRSANAQTCFSYEPSAVVLQGTIRRHTFAGPPNYESIAKGDKPEDVWLLHLTAPLCVSANATWQKERDVSRVQLVFADGPKEYERYRRLLDQKAIVTGTLFHAQTGHHHTRVLVTVRSIKRK